MHSATWLVCSILCLVTHQCCALNATICEKGFFGENCEYQCHCHGSKDNCLKNGTCTQGCESKWMGPECQHYVQGKWVFSKELDSKNGISCPNNNLTSILIDVEDTVITWMRVWTNGDVSEMGEDVRIVLDGVHLSCARPDPVPIEDGTFDLYCPQPVERVNGKVEIKAKHLNRWCKVLVTLGRNFALKQITEIGPENERTHASKLVDGDNGTCSTLKYGENTTWSVYFEHPIEVARIRFIFPRRKYLKFAVVEVYSGSKRLDSFSFTNDMARRNRVAIAKEDKALFDALLRYVTHITIRRWSSHPRTVIILCEVQVFGECPRGRMGKCDTECNCVAKAQYCYSRKRCLSGCANGFFGKNCTERCPTGTWGSRCEHRCSPYCNMSVCDTGTGACTEGCAGGYRPPLCREASVGNAAAIPIETHTGSALSVLVMGLLLAGLIGAVLAISKKNIPLAGEGDIAALGTEVAPKKSRLNPRDATIQSKHQLDGEKSSVEKKSDGGALTKER